MEYFSLFFGAIFLLATLNQSISLPRTADTENHRTKRDNNEDVADYGKILSENDFFVLMFYI